jgi:hypothetical protein
MRPDAPKHPTDHLYVAAADEEERIFHCVLIPLPNVEEILVAVFREVRGQCSYPSKAHAWFAGFLGNMHWAGKG